VTILINHQQAVPLYLPTIRHSGRLIHALTDPLCADLLEAKDWMLRVKFLQNCSLQSFRKPVICWRIFTDQYSITESVNSAG
jgi:hypothetical protein